MKITNVVLLTLSVLFSTLVVATAQTGVVPASADDVVARMLNLEAQRQAQLNGYTATRHYVAVNRQRKAEMVVAVNCGADGVKQFTILSEEGSHAIRKHAFYKMLKEESDASRGDSRESTRITPANYQFQMAGNDIIDGRQMYVLQITPKEDQKYLIHGKIWVDAADYSIVRIEGRPARNPSFWVRGVQFVRTYQKVGSFWLPASTYSVSQVRIFGESELTIENSGYSLNPPANRTTKTEYQARITQ